MLTATLPRAKYSIPLTRQLKCQNHLSWAGDTLKEGNQGHTYRNRHPTQQIHPAFNRPMSAFGHTLIRNVRQDIPREVQSIRIAAVWVVAASVEIQGDQLALVDSQGRLAALFLMELVES